jgi:uncharacterized protein YjiS (DUF1127 family)
VAAAAVPPASNRGIDMKTMTMGSALGLGLAGVVALMARRAWGAALAELAARRAVRDLQAMDAHLLHDLGIGRGEIVAVVRGGR